MQPEKQDDEIELSQFVYALVNNKIWVAFVAALVSTSVWYFAYKVAKNEFASEVRFELLDPSSDSGSTALGVGGLGALAGISVGVGEAGKLSDRILSRPFVDKIYDELHFESDPIFNGFIAEPTLVGKLKILLWGRPTRIEPTRDDLLVSAIGALRKRMALVVGENEIIYLSIRHRDSARAALVANAIVDQTLADLFQRDREAARASLTYFAEELLRVRSDLDAASAAVRDYALRNNLQSAGILAQTSSQMVQLRGSINEIQEAISAVKILSAVDAIRFSGEEFDAEFGNVLSASVRREFGWSAEDPAAWQLPEEQIALQELSKLQDQEKKLLSNLSELQAKALASGEAALELEQLEREVQVQQSIYQSVITQFETQSLFSGQERASGRVLERAIATRSPSGPKRLRIALLGILGGIVFGSLLVVVLSIIRGSSHGKTKLQAGLGLKHSSDLPKSLLPAIGETPSSDAAQNAFQSILFSLNDSIEKIVIVSPNRDSLSLKFASGLLSIHRLIDETAAVLDLTQVNVEQKDRESSEIDGLTKTKEQNIFRLSNETRILTPTKLKKLLSELTKSHSRVYVAAPGNVTSSAKVAMITEQCDNTFLILHGNFLSRAAMDSLNVATRSVSREKKRLFLC